MNDVLSLIVNLLWGVLGLIVSGFTAKVTWLMFMLGWSVL